MWTLEAWPEPARVFSSSGLGVPRISPLPEQIADLKARGSTGVVVEEIAAEEHRDRVGGDEATRFEGQLLQELGEDGSALKASAKAGFDKGGIVSQ